MRRYWHILGRDYNGGNMYTESTARSNGTAICQNNDVLMAVKITAAASISLRIVSDVGTIGLMLRRARTPRIKSKAGGTT